MFKNATTRFPRLFPPLTPQSVAASVVDAVLKNKAKVVLPFYLAGLEILKSLVPFKVYFDVADYVINHDECFTHIKQG